MERKLSYVDAIREATDQEMARDSSVVVFGLDVDDPKAIQGTTRGLQEKYGPERVFGTPLSEDGMTGIAIGMALAGLRPMHIHIRMDFLLLAMNQLINVAAKARYMYGGQVRVPLVVRAMIGKSWGQGAQHSQALYSFFMHIPGVKVVAPTTPYDAKGCLIHAIRDNDPVLYIEHRILHFQSGLVPEASYAVSPGKARVVTEGRDVTLVGISYMQVECIRAQRYLQSIGISAEVIDPDLVKPIGHRYGCSIRVGRRGDCAWSTMVGPLAAPAAKLSLSSPNVSKGPEIYGCVGWALPPPRAHHRPLWRICSIPMAEK